MSYYFAKATDVIPARAEEVYAVLSDYRVGHLAILPKQFFKRMDVLQGGVGAGTVVEVETAVFNVTRIYTLTVTEPEPGRILSETDAVQDVTTTFTIDPIEDGEHCQVTIATRGKTSSGIQGVLEKMFNPSITRRIFRDELKQIANYMISKKGQAQEQEVS